MTETTETTAPVVVFICAFCFSGIAGLAAFLRSNNSATFMKVFTAIINSGLLGLGVSLLWYTNFRENIYGLIGICVLIGLGGMTTLELVLSLFRKGGFKIIIGEKDEGDKQ